MARWHICNVVEVEPAGTRLWQFEARKDRFVLKEQVASSDTKPLPPKLVARSLSWLWSKKLNVALLPPERVFIRVLHLPKGSYAELVSMVELQLEKLSPLPLTQIVWSLHALPQQTKDGLQPVVVVIAARDKVEEYLGKLEAQGFLADRLELAALDQLLNFAPDSDGVWVFPETAPGPSGALVAWWIGGALQHIGLILAPPGRDMAAAVRDQIYQMAWGGELEGWLKGLPPVHLVAGPATRAQWEHALHTGLGAPVAVAEPLPPEQLAAHTARRAAESEPRPNLLPLEFATRYQQQFVDRLWMRGLGVVIGVYVLFTLIHLGAAQVIAFRAQLVEKQVAAIAPQYTNAIQLMQRYDVLRERHELKYAALDCWKVVAELLPQDLTLQGLDFAEGRRLTLNGTAPAESVNQVIDFYEAMRKAKLGDQPMFTRFGELSYRKDPSGPTVSWNFVCELNRAETP
ncbi:MAG: hypothetical protein N2379_09555 [Verrucomicrobiae bacterium]|nr:hypothetical protein [Verrucomicrobiae bacterium]